MVRIGLAGAAMAGSVTQYLAGENFLMLISFLGCAPSITITPGTGDGEPCLVDVPRAMARPVLRIGRNTKASACPDCGARISPAAGATELQCSECGSTHAAWALKWRRSACCARVWIDISGVHESEAVPVAKLLDQLAGFSAVSWDYCYLRP